HFRITARERLQQLFDGDWQELDATLTSADPLSFRDQRVGRIGLGLALGESRLIRLRVAEGQLEGIRCIVAAMEYGFIGGSMGVVVGEKVTRCIERALAERVPLVVVSCSGGARMMEGAL